MLSSRIGLHVYARVFYSLPPTLFQWGDSTGHLDYVAKSMHVLSRGFHQLPASEKRFLSTASICIDRQLRT